MLLSYLDLFSLYIRSLHSKILLQLEDPQVVSPNEFNIFVIWFTFTELISAGFETRYLCLFTKLLKLCLKLYQFISAGVDINDGPKQRQFPHPHTNPSCTNWINQPTFLGLSKYQKGEFTSSTISFYQKSIFIF